MSLIKSGNIFDADSFPINVNTVQGRELRVDELHRHEYYELLFVKEGTLTCRFKGSEEVLKKGDVLIIKPYVLHMLVDMETEDREEAYFCSFLPQAADLNLQSLENLKGSNSPMRYYFKAMISLCDEEVAAIKLTIGEGERSEIEALLNDLRIHSHDPTERGHAVLRFQFLALLAFLTEQHEKAEENSCKVKQELNVSVSRCMNGLRNTLNHIHNHYDEDLTLEQMAAMCGTAEPYFCRLFKSETGSTFMTYLNSLRIKKSCELLRDTTDSALEICYVVGFNNYPRFSRQFKKNKGISPVEFRKQEFKSRTVRRVALQGAAA